MKILVCIKQVPDTTTKLNLLPNGTGVDEKGIKWEINPYDQFAVEEALQIKAKNPQANIHVVSLGPKARVIESLRTALAMGADEASVIDATETCDSYVTSKALAGFCDKTGPYDLILTGKMAIDDSQAAVPQMLASSLNLSHVTPVSKIELQGEKALVERDIEGGSKEKIETQSKAVFGANKGLNTPRYASLPGIMKAKKKPVGEFSLSDFSLESSSSKTSIKSYQLPKERPAVRMLAGEAKDQAAALVKALREESKVL